jgi:hypothetical protein
MNVADLQRFPSAFIHIHRGTLLEGSLCASYTHATVTAPTSATICVTPRALLTLAGISRPTLNYPVAAIREGECDADEQRGLYALDGAKPSPAKNTSRRLVDKDLNAAIDSIFRTVFTSVEWEVVRCCLSWRSPPKKKRIPLYLWKSAVNAKWHE